MNAQITLLLFVLTASIGFAQNCTADFTFGPTDLTIDFIDQSSAPNGDPIVAWDWDFGDGSGSTQQNPTHTFPDPDNYDVCLTIQTSSGCTDQLCIEIETCVLQLSVSVGDCNANNEIPLTINVSDPYDAARDINISVDGVLLPGSPFDIDDNAPVAVNTTVAGDGLTHVVTVQSEDVGTCAATYEFTVPDCTSDCFLSSMSTTLVGGTTHTVDVGDNFFAPQNVTIVIGDVVRFEWVGDGHSTTSDATTGPDSWNSGVIGFGSTYDVNITNPGVHGYYCLPHGGPNGQGMAGTIIGNCPPGGQFTVSVGFSTAVADPQGYQLLVDGVPVAGSPFTYSGTGAQSQTISLPGDGVQHVVEIQDVADPSCTISRNFLAPNCGAAPACSLSVTAAQNGGCTTGNQIPYELTVNAINPGVNGFEVLIDGVAAPNGPFTYGNGGITTVIVDVPGDGGSHTIVVQDVADSACSGSTSVTTTDCTIPCAITNLMASTGGSAVHTVNVEDFAFSPQSITIAAGDIVEWAWTGSVAHTATSDAASGPDSWDSGLLGQGAVYQSPVLSAGVHPYYCIPHGGPGGQGMAGTITVQADCTNGQVQANLSFSGSGTGVDGYEVLVDGALAGTFAYDASGQNSASVPVPGDGGTHTITVRDAADNSCSASTTLTTPDCNAPTCQLSVSAEETGGCSNGDITATLTVTDAGGSALGFEVQVDGASAGTFSYSGSGTTTVQIPIAGDGQPHDIQATDLEDGSCTASASLTTTDCTIPCAITNLMASTGGSAVHTVNVEDFAFSPQSITIAAGDIVEWAWTGSVAHTATSDAASGPDSWDSGLLGQGAVYQSPVLSAGVHPYYCIPHGGPDGQGMAGTITVQADCTNGQVQANLSFSGSGTGVDGYEVLVDGALAGTFAYDASGQNSASVPVPGDGGTHTITVRDAADNSCSASTTLTTPDCNAPTCQLSVSAEETGGCSNGDITATLTVSDAGGSALGFEVQVDGASAGTFSYSGTGTTTVEIPIAGDGQPHDIQVTDLVDGTCTASGSLTTTDCTIPCAITNLTASTGGSAVHTVNVEDFAFSPQTITIAAGDIVEWSWTGSVAHTATSDAASGPDSWDSGLLGQGAVYQSPVLSAGVHPYYCIPHGGPGGQGMAGTITVQADCTNGQVQANLSFSGSGTGVDGYEVLVDGALAGTFAYDASGQNSASVPVPGDGGTHTITVRDAADNSCSASTTLTTPDCNAPTCQLSVSAEETGGCNNGDITATLTVTDAGGSALGFEVQVDGASAGTFSYSGTGTTTVEIPIAGDGQPHDIQVTDLEDGACAASGSLTTTDCTIPCAITNLMASTGGSAVHTVNVEDFAFSPQSITIAAGDIVEWAWTGSVAHTATSDAASGPDSWDSGLLGQGAVYQSPVLSAGVHPYYCIPHGGPGGQGMAGTITVQADCTNGQVQANLSFSGSGTGVDGYEVLVDGALAGTFSYDASGQNSASVPVPGDGSTHTITVRDAADNSCSASTTLTTPDCNAPTCQLSVSAEETGGCSNGDITATLTVTDAGGSALGFEVQVDGASAGTFSYSGTGTTTVQIPIAGDGQPHDIQVTDLEDGACAASGSLTTTDCTIPCAITNLMASTGGSAVHTVNVEDFAFSPQSITIAAGDIVEWAWTGSVAHTATSDATSGPDSWDSGLLGQGAVYQSPVLSAGVHPYYCIPHGGPGGQGMAGTITVQADCTNGQVQANLSFSGSGTGVDGYEVLVDGALAGTFSYDASGQNSASVPVPGDGGTHTITVRDAADNSCSASTTLTTPDCNAPTCQLSVSAEETGGCSNGDITATLTVTDAGGSALGFEVQVDGAIAGTFSYSGTGTTTVQIPIVGDGQPHDIQVTDLEDGTCTASASLTTADCTIPCAITNLTLNTSGSPVVHTIEVQDFEFVPQQLTVAPGDTIRFLWTGAIPHTTTSDAVSGADSWDSGLLGQGAVYDVVPEALGEHPYYCIPHGAPGGIGMAGNITVQPPCNEGQVNLLATFSSTGGGNAYNVLLDGTALPGSPFPYASGSAQSVQVAVPGDGLEHTLLVQDDQSAGCEAAFTFTAPECNTAEPCGLSLAAEVTEDCDAGNQVSVGLTIGHTGTTGSSFQLLVDGVTHPDSPFSYAQGGVTQLSILLAGNGMMRNFEVVDSNSLDCSATTTLEVPQCGAICEIQQLSVNSSGAANHQILVEDFEFQPAVLTAAPGDTITFVWTGSIPHTTTSDATSGPGSWDSGLLGQGATYQLVLNEEGSYPYYCTPHGGPGGIGMAGTIHIEDPCNAGQGTIGVSFETTNGSALGYQVFVDGNLVAGPIAYDDPTGFNTTSITIPGDGMLHTLTVQDLEIGFCAASTTFTAPLCEMPCAILNLEANVGAGVAHVIEVRDFDFFPAVTSVRVGETIRFNWTGAIPHTATSDASTGPDSWDSGLLEQGDSFEVAIQEPGEHPYYCIPHGGPGGIGMAGMIVADPDCLEDSVQVAVMFEVTNGSAQGYNLFIDGQLTEGAPFSYTNPMGTNMVFVNLPGDGQQHFVTVQDLEVGFCAATTSVLVPDCSAPCSVDSLSVEFPSPALHEVLVEDFEFLPAQLDVYTGDTVRFVWTGSIPHTATSDAANGPDSWDSGLLGQGAFFDVVLNEPGSHPYYCTPHGGPGGIGMAGVINASAPCEGDSILTTIYFSDTNAEGPFEVSLDGVFWTIINGSGSAVYLPGDGEPHELIVQDANVVECADTLTFTTPMCDTDEPVFCGLSLVLDQISSCEDGMVGYDLGLSVVHTGNTGYNLFVDGILQTGSPFSYNDLPAMLTLEGDGLPHEIIVADADSTACADTATVVTPDCSQGCLLSLDSLVVGPAVVHVVEVRDFDFLPAELEVAVGDVVRFVWTGAVPHTATSDATTGPDSWNSGLLGEGAVFEVAITTAGPHPYYCVPHGGPGGIGMAGLITAAEPCADGMLNAEVHFQSSNTGAEGFEVLIDGMLTAGSPYPYAAGGSQMAGIAIPADGQIHEVQVRDALQADCQFTTEVEMPDCSDPCLGYSAGFSAAPTNNSLEVAFTDETELNVTSWSWSFGDGTNSTAQNPVHVFPTAGTYTVCLTVMDNSTGCLDMHCSEVEVSSTLCNIDFALFSDGLSVTLVDATQSTAPVQDWSWNLGNGTTISGQDSITYTYADLGTYTICLEVLADGCSGELCQEIDLTDPCLLFAPGFTYTVNPEDPLSVQFVDLTSGMPNQWLWGFGDGMTSHQQNPVHTYSSSGTYNICLLVQDTITGCNKALCESIFMGTTGSAATEQVNYSVTITPNPAPMGQPNWTVSGIHPADYQQDLQLFIYDLQGRLLTEGQVKGKPDLAVEAPFSASAGMYIVELRSSRRVYQGRVILQ